MKQAALLVIVAVWALAVLPAGCHSPGAAHPEERREQGEADALPAGAPPADVPVAKSPLATAPTQNDKPDLKEDEPSVRLGPSPPATKGKTERIDLVAVLRLAGAESIDVKIYQQHLEAARADLATAGSKFLPDLNVGVVYRRHDGRIQETQGSILEASKSSLDSGPGLSLHVDPAEAYFARLEALQVVDAVREGGRRTRAEVMLRSAFGYLDLLQAKALVEVATEARDHARAQTELSRQMVDVQAELRVNLARAQAAQARDEQRLLAAQNAVRSASVDLSVLLRLEPGTVLEPAEDRIAPVTLVSPEAELSDLIENAVKSRPDLKELAALSRAARERQSGVKFSPWVPDVDVFLGWSSFGGGRNDKFGNFGDRVDVGAGLVWTFEGFGFGEAARTRRARAAVRAARLQVEGKREEIVGEVIRTWETIGSLRASIDAAHSRVRASRETAELVQARYESGDAIQLEILEAQRDDAESRAALVHAIIEYSKAQNLLHYQVYGATWEKG